MASEITPPATAKGSNQIPGEVWGIAVVIVFGAFMAGLVHQQGSEW